MIDITLASAEILSEAGFSTTIIDLGERAGLAFESDTVLGFLIAYDGPDDLLAAWDKDAERAVASQRFGLRRAGQKAWNTYMVLLAGREADFAGATTLGAIEEDLVGTRKIARAGTADMSDLRAALLPLLPLQAAPMLEAVNMPDEIRERTTELPARAIEAFFSNANEAAIIQVLEEAP
jgi:hypothetical protein